MFKSAFALAAVVAATFGGVAQAAEVGIRTESGYSTRTITGGHQWSEYEGTSKTRTRTVSVSRSSHGDLDAGTAVATPNGANHGNTSGTDMDRARGRSRTVTKNRTKEEFSGGSRNDFTGTDVRVFSSSSVFAN